MSTLTNTRNKEEAVEVTYEVVGDGARPAEDCDDFFPRIISHDEPRWQPINSNM